MSDPDNRVAVSRGNLAVVIGLYGFDFATQHYCHAASLDAIDDKMPERRVHLLTAAERRALDEEE